MFEIISGVTLFGVTLGGANALQQYTKGRGRTLAIMLVWYVWWIIVCVLILKFPGLIICIAGMLSLLYLTFLSVWRSVSSGALKYPETIPEPFQTLSRPTVLSAVPKTLEIFIQDIAAWLIVGGLFMYVMQWWLVAIVFSSVVFALHIPGIKMFGPVYGGYFLYMSTMFAFIVPLCYQIGYLGFCIVYGVHILGYVVMHLVFQDRR